LVSIIGAESQITRTSEQEEENREKGIIKVKGRKEKLI